MGTVVANNTRVEDSETTTGWSNRGGGAGVAAEAPLAYQGSNTVNRKISSSTGAGFQYDPTSDGGSAQNMTAAATSHWMVKVIVTDPGGLRANDGVRMYIGTGTPEYAFVIAGTDAVKGAYDSYLLRTATIIVPVNPNIAGYRDATHSSGTPSLTAVDKFGIEAEFALGTAKAENVGVDAIDLGTGLTLTGTSSVWADFVDADEGTTGNRWGYANSIYGTSGVIFFFGQMTLGSATSIAFDDTTSSILWPDGLYDAGFSRVFADLQNASSTIVDGSTHTSLGTTNVVDTRADYIWSGTSGTGTASHTLNNFRNYVMTSAVTVDGANIQCVDLTQGDGTIQDSTIRCNSASGVAVINDANFANLSGVNFVQSGSGHAIEITSAGSYTFSGHNFTGFGADGTTSAAVYNNSGGVVTINVSGGGSPTVRNGTGASTTVNNTVDLTLTGLIASSEIRIFTAGTQTELDGVENSGTTFTYSYNYVSDFDVDIVILSLDYKNIKLKSITLSSSSTSIPIQQQIDRQYLNP